MIRNRSVLTAAVIVLLAAGPTRALQQAEIRFDPAAPLSPLEREDGELEAYSDIVGQEDLARRLSLINRFLVDYPTSEFRHLVLREYWEAQIEREDLEEVIAAASEALEAQEHFRTAKLGFIAAPNQIRNLPEFRYGMATQEAEYYKSMVEATRDLGNFDQVVAFGELGLEAATRAWNLYGEYANEASPDYQIEFRRNREIQAFILFNILEGYESAGDLPRILEYRERVLDLAPNDFQTLMTTARLMVEQPVPDGEDPDAYARRALEYAERAVAQLDVMMGGPAALTFDDSRRADLAGYVYFTLGRARFQLEDWAGAAAAFQTSIESIPDDPVAYFMLGLAARQTQDLETFLSAYARAVFLEIPQPLVRTDLETIWTAINGSGDGLDAFIQREGRQIPSAVDDDVLERTAYIEELLADIDVLPTVFPPNRMCYPYYEFLASQDLTGVDSALEIGVGSGVNSIILLDRGVPRLVGTDINENAVQAFEQNAAKYGHANRIDPRLVSLDDPEAYSVIGDDERFDLIISNPPWEDLEPRRIQEYAYLDSGWVLLRSMLEGMAGHLTEDGRVWLLYGDPRAIPAPVPPAVEIILQEAPEHNLTPTVLYRDNRCSIVEIVVGN